MCILTDLSVNVYCICREIEIVTETEGITDTWKKELERSGLQTHLPIPSFSGDCQIVLKKKMLVQIFSSNCNSKSITNTHFKDICIPTEIECLSNFHNLTDHL